MAVVRIFRVFRIPWLQTQITCNNFGYRSLKSELVFGFFGLRFFGFGLGFFRFGLRVICPPIGLIPPSTPFGSSPASVPLFLVAPRRPAPYSIAFSCDFHSTIDLVCSINQARCKVHHSDSSQNIVDPFSPFEHIAARISNRSLRLFLIYCQRKQSASGINGDNKKDEKQKRGRKEEKWRDGGRS